jgi:DNA-binding transcriptional regulator PaaX
MFDIAQIKRQDREALRGKLKQLGFFLFQKSVWVIPYSCEKEIKMLKDFFGLKDYEIRLITVSDIGEDGELKEFFKL